MPGSKISVAKWGRSWNGLLKYEGIVGMQIEELLVKSVNKNESSSVRKEWMKKYTKINDERILLDEKKLGKGEIANASSK